MTTRPGIASPRVRVPPRAGQSPADLLRALRRAVDEELTPRQRQVFVAVALNDVEIDVVAGELQSSRGAVYKVLHDARTKLRRRLEHEGHLEQEGAR